MNKYIITCLGLVLGTHAAMADDAWSLQQCVDYALANNISVRSSALQAENADLDVTAAKDAFLPTVSASASEGFNFGRGLTSENIYANRNTSNFQWGLSMSVPLFQGLSDVRQLKVARSTLRRYLLEHEVAREDVTLNVIAQYLQVLYSREITGSARAQLEYSTYEVERQRALVDAGKVAEASLYDAEAQQAQDRLQVITSENDERVALVNLANLLQLKSADGFDVLPLEEEDPEIPGPDIVYSRATEHNSSILAARQSIQVARDNISLAKTGYIPRLNFDASIGSSYYTVSGLTNEPFGGQMRNNFSTYLLLWNSTAARASFINPSSLPIPKLPVPGRSISLPARRLRRRA